MGLGLNVCKLSKNNNLKNNQNMKKKENKKCINQIRMSKIYKKEMKMGKNLQII